MPSTIAFLAQGRLHGRTVSTLQGDAEGEGRVLLELEFVQEDGFVSFPADEQGFGRLAGRRPALDEGVEVGIQGQLVIRDDTDRAPAVLCVEKWDEEAEANPSGNVHYDRNPRRSLAPNARLLGLSAVQQKKSAPLCREPTSAGRPGRPAKRPSRSDSSPGSGRSMSEARPEDSSPPAVRAIAAPGAKSRLFP